MEDSLTPYWSKCGTPIMAVAKTAFWLLNFRCRAYFRVGVDFGNPDDALGILALDTVET
ncbi:hypothetical protein PENANT_c049G00682 [Penicillium antarcticum]|uniref:Uncharacterized protein n=1 Tax=Penicillium antarcticum TaxID=416450 RepID=A0A1V6PRB2_9EURO|nr:hypothetical protein PENANT_c049G00682 [Penicillium antarcticum]